MDTGNAKAGGVMFSVQFKLAPVCRMMHGFKGLSRWTHHFLLIIWLSGLTAAPPAGEHTWHVCLWSCQSVYDS